MIRSGLGHMGCKSAAGQQGVCNSEWATTLSIMTFWCETLRMGHIFCRGSLFLSDRVGGQTGTINDHRLTIIFRIRA